MRHHDAERPRNMVGDPWFKVCMCENPRGHVCAEKCMRVCVCENVYMMFSPTSFRTKQHLALETIGFLWFPAHVCWAPCAGVIAVVSQFRSGQTCTWRSIPPRPVLTFGQCTNKTIPHIRKLHVQLGGRTPIWRVMLAFSRTQCGAQLTVFQARYPD